jgi:hypothetical protein
LDKRAGKLNLESFIAKSQAIKRMIIGEQIIDAR